uniref:Uncharacterized protein n=1 Tax=uncultured prokaryote TaxID=198431 RepID=H5SPM5_9ZZZZ|nr:hypothetical protein HGMM_F54D01C38 [uncultured prokaryote]
MPLDVAEAGLPTPAATVVVVMEGTPTPAGSVRPEEECAEEPRERQAGCLAARYQAMEAEDWAKEPFRGQLGPFEVVPAGGRAGTAQSPCMEPKVQMCLAPERAGGELAFPLPASAGEGYGGAVCDDGTVVSIGASVQLSDVDSWVWRAYYVDELLPVPERAPRERWLLMEIAGFEALVELPTIREPAVFSRGTIWVIERLPEPGKPGISWGMNYFGSVEQAMGYLAGLIALTRGQGP